MADEHDTDDIVNDFRQRLGPEFEYLADGLAPAIAGLVEGVSKSTVERTVEPIRATQDALNVRAADEQTAATMKTFAERHPDWQEHEAEILTLAEGLRPNGIDELAYLDQRRIG